MEAPPDRGSISVHADAVQPPAGGPQGGEGLADPVVLRLLEVIAQDSPLVLQLLREERHRCKKKTAPKDIV